jgi:hypothetical protein
MEESAFRSAEELEARRSLHEAIGRFVVAFELVVAELRSACSLMLERGGLGLRNQALASIVLARVGAAELAELAGALYREFRPADSEGAQALEPILKRIDKLRESRNRVIHAAWTLGIPNQQGGVEHVAHSLTFGRTRSKGQTVREQALCPADFDELTTEATRLQVYAMRLSYSVNQTDLPLAEQLNKPL